MDVIPLINWVLPHPAVPTSITGHMRSTRRDTQKLIEQVSEVGTVTCSIGVVPEQEKERKT